jgi:hypothetical protein
MGDGLPDLTSSKQEKGPEEERSYALQALLFLTEKLWFTHFQQF